MNSVYMMKNFEYIRDFVRDFYFYGFKSRHQFKNMSGTAYDNRLKLMQAILPEYIDSYFDEGKKHYVPINSRVEAQNPLFRLFKIKSFTTIDILLWFNILDFLNSEDVICSNGATIKEICNIKVVSEYDEKTVRIHIKEYCKLGVICAKKVHGEMRYSLAADPDIFTEDFCSAIRFFSEIAPCGVIGSYILDRHTEKDEIINFKHHCISNALDSEITYQLFDAIRQKQPVEINYVNRRNEMSRCLKLIPLSVYIGSKTGRQYVMVELIDYPENSKGILSLRIDYIKNLKPIEDVGGYIHNEYEKAHRQLTAVQNNIWGVSIIRDQKPKKVSFQVMVGANEDYIYSRIEREKRCGTVTRQGDLVSFEAELMDPQEVVPWVRSFIGRIVRVDFSEPVLTKKFYDDIKALYDLYNDGSVQEGE